MTPPVRPESTATTGLPPLHRILNFEEWQQAQQMSPAALATHPFPVVPPIPKPTPLSPADEDVPEPEPPHVLTLGRRGQHGLGPLGEVNAPSGAGIQALSESLHMTLSDAINKVRKVATQGYSVQDMIDDVYNLGGPKLIKEGIDERDPSKILLGGLPLVGGAIGGARALAGRSAAGEAAGAVASGIEERAAGPVNPFSGTPAQRTARIQSAIQQGQAAQTAKVAVQQHMTNVAQAVQTIAPRDHIKGILRANLGEMNAVVEQAAHQVDDFRRAIDPLPRADKLAYIDAIEGGASQVTPEFQAPADFMRQALDAQRTEVQNLGTGALQHYINDYFPHAWTDPNAAALAIQAQQAKILGRRPLEGTKASLRERTIPTTVDGIAMGLEPLYDNPVDLFMYKMRDMQRYIMAHRTFNEASNAGLMQFVRVGSAPPQGYTRINDNIARVRSVNPAGQLVVHGEYWAPKEVAGILNNHLSPGLPQILRDKWGPTWGEAAASSFEAYRFTGNVINQAQLGLSAFHLGFTSFDAAVSQAALGAEYLIAGKPLAALKKIGGAPAAPLAGILQGGVVDYLNKYLGTDIQLGLGAKIRQAYLDPSKATPEMTTLANALKESNMATGQDWFYRNSAPEKMIAAWHKGGFLGGVKAVAWSPIAGIEMISRPLMQHIVPLQKFQVFGQLAQKILSELPPQATAIERRAAFQRAADSVENRMGQLRYDNLFWDRTFKDLAMASTRSVGWNLGTIRELGGGIGDIVNIPIEMAHGKSFKEAFTHRAAYTATLPIAAGLVGAIYQYLRTGEGPAELKDYFYPRTGETDADGNAERVQLPSYMKDMVAYAGSPWQTVKHKIAPLPNMLFEMLQNEDFYGDQIRNEQDPIIQQMKQEADFVLKGVVPFTFRNLSEQSARGDQSIATKAGGFVGMTPAPRRMVRSPAQNLMADYLKGRAPSGATPEDAEARKFRTELLQSMRGIGGIDVEKVNAALESGNLTPADIGRLLKRAGMTPAQEKFKRLTLEQALAVFDKGTPREQALFAEALVKKVENARP